MNRVTLVLRASRAFVRSTGIFLCGIFMIAALGGGAQAACPSCGAGACPINSLVLDDVGCTTLNAPNADITINAGQVVESNDEGHVYTINARSLTIDGSIVMSRGTLNIRVKNALTVGDGVDAADIAIDVSSESNDSPKPKVTIERFAAGNNPTVTINNPIDAGGGGSSNKNGGDIFIQRVSTITVNAPLLAKSGTSGLGGGAGGDVTLKSTGDITMGTNGDVDVTSADQQAGDILIQARGNVTVAGTLDAKSTSGNSSSGGTVTVKAGANHSLTISGTIEVTADNSATVDGDITIGPACSVDISGTLDAFYDTDHTSGTVKITYHGSLDTTGATIQANTDSVVTPNANTIECRCDNVTTAGACAASSNCAGGAPASGAFAPAPTVNKLPLRACQSEAVLLIDTSGSMTLKPNGDFTSNDSERRITLAKSSALLFVDLLDAFSVGTAKIGVARFPIQPYEECTADAVMDPLALNAGGNTAAETTITNLNPGNMTPLLDGLTKANGMFTPGQDTNRAIVLLSDGYHNCPTEVPWDSAIAAPFVSARTRVHTIAFGPTPSTPTAFLASLAGATSGQFHDVTLPFTPSIALGPTFSTVLVDSFGLDTSVDPLDSINGGAVETHQVSVNSYDDSVAVVLGWETPSRRRLLLEVTASDGQIITKEDPTVRWVERENHKILIASSDFLQQPGKVSATPWTVRVDARNVPAADEEPYHYELVADSTLNMRTGVGPEVVRTGSVLTMTAKLTESEAPVTGSPTVTVTVTSPEDGVGNWLIANPVQAQTPDVVPGQDTASALALRADALRANGLVPPGRMAPGKMTLFDDGTHGDATAKDGIYTNQFTDTRKEGTYAFFFEASGTDDSGVQFQRQDIVHRNLALALDTSSSKITTTKLATPNQFLITVDPRDKFGNHLGPDRSVDLVIAASAEN